MVLLGYGNIQICEGDKVGFRHHNCEGLEGGRLDRLTKRYPPGERNGRRETLGSHVELTTEAQNRWACD